MTASQPVPVDSLEVRSRLVEAVKLDLVGPWAGHELGAEQLPGRERPSNWYVAGFLIPTGTPPDRSGDVDENDDLDTVPESAGLAEESNDERKAARKAFFPSSIARLRPGCRDPCEMRNDHLDRALVVPVLGMPHAAFFGPAG
jgi:hypothetical protein